MPWHEVHAHAYRIVIESLRSFSISLLVKRGGGFLRILKAVEFSCHIDSQAMGVFLHRLCIPPASIALALNCVWAAQGFSQSPRANARTFTILFLAVQLWSKLAEATRDHCNAQGCASPHGRCPFRTSCPSPLALDHVVRQPCSPGFVVTCDHEERRGKG